MSILVFFKIIMVFRYKKITYLLLLLILAITECFSQSQVLKGRVMDSDTQKPIAGIAVQVLGTNTSSVTDRKGYYSVLIPENLSNVEFGEFVDKKLSRLQEVGENEINIYLTDLSADDLYGLSLEELMNIRVSVVSKEAESINEAPGIVSVVTAKEIESFGASTLRDVLERVTSVVGLTGFNNRNVISMRGDQVSVANEHVLFTINGRPSREIIKGGADSDIYAMFPLNSIKQIEIIRGPGSVLYGTNAFTGVINIVTNNNKEFLSASFEAGAPWAKIASVSGGSKLGSGMFSAAVQYKKLADWQQAFTTELDVDTSFNTNEEGFGAFLAYDCGNLTINSSIIGWNTFLVSPINGGNTASVSRQFIDAEYDLNFSEKIRASLNATYTHCYFDGTPNHTIRNSNDLIFEAINYIHPAANFNIVVGALVNLRSGIAKHQESWGDIVESMPLYSVTRYSFYSQADYSYKTLKLLVGIQAHKHLKGRGAKYIPRAGIVWNPEGKFLIKALYGNAYRAPTANETILNDPKLVGNPRLGAEFVETFDLELAYKSKKIHSALTVFRSHQSNIIVRDFRDEPEGFINRGNFIAKGIEFEGKYFPVNNWYFLGSMSYQTNVLSNREDIEDFTTAPFTAKFGFSYSSNFGLSLGVFNCYNSKPPDVILRFPNRKVVNPVPEAFNLLSANIRLDLSEISKIKNNIVLNTRAENLLGEEIYNAEWVRARINSIPGKPGRRIYFGIAASF